MNTALRLWRQWRHGHKFARIGKHCLFPAGPLRVEGHVELGDHVRIREGCILRTHRDGEIIIGSRGGLSFYCVLEATNRIEIGDFTGIAEFTVIRDTNHVVIGTDAHWRTTPHVAEPIVIGNSCLIGSRCYIGPGVTIGDGAVIAPGSMITKDVGPLEIWAGSPARLVAHRTKNVSPAMLRRFQDLVAKYGLREDRHGIYQEYQAAQQVDSRTESQTEAPAGEEEPREPDIVAED
ncbi:MAG: acyltransferase [Candidatus Hydrogenedentes bacterium]|nr:acyltransferase [Candidatus Hydrogenedentota bacterium]